MKVNNILLAALCASSPLFADSNQHLEQQVQLLQKHSKALQRQITQLQRQVHVQQQADHKADAVSLKKAGDSHEYHSSKLTVHTPDAHPESVSFYPTALVADNHVVTYIAGTPVVSSPYLGDRPAFDGSDYIVNISSINRDIRLMQQRRRLFQAYEHMGYPVPHMPIIAISGKTEPQAVMSRPFAGTTDGDLTLGSSEIDFAAALNRDVEAYIAVAYDSSPPSVGPRINNSAFNLNMGFVNIGDLDKTPLYFTAGQLFVPFGRYSSAMITAPLTMNLARTKTRPFILGYKSQEDSGLFAAVYGYKSDTTLGKSGVGGANLGYIITHNDLTAEIGASYISSIDDAAGMQSTGSTANSTFGGFASYTNGNESVRKTPALDIHANASIDRYNFAAEWVSVAQGFRTQDLSFNGQGATPQAGQLEANMTFRLFNRPSSLGVGYQWSKEALALNLPEQSVLAVYNISIWKDTVESLEYRHDWDYAATQYANGAAPVGAVNANTYGTGAGADTLSVQVGVYF